MTIVDSGFRIAYRTAYQLMRIYWRVARPTTKGALIAIWHNGELLLVRNSYVSYYCVPGGYLKPGETPVMAAVREVAEEVSIQARPGALRVGREETHTWEGKSDEVTIFDLEVEERPAFRIDRREVITAGFYSPRQALAFDLFPPLRRHIEARLTKDPG